eukprot:scaffold19482_cov24-Prasinocladus_malaysianus.AAC.1
MLLLVVGRMVGDEALAEEAEPVMPGEDFAFLAQKAPGCMVFLGIRNETAGSVHALHNPAFTMDEEQLQRGAALHTAIAFEYLRTGSDRKTEL